MIQLGVQLRFDCAQCEPTAAVVSHPRQAWEYDEATPTPSDVFKESTIHKRTCFNSIIAVSISKAIHVRTDTYNILTVSIFLLLKPTAKKMEIIRFFRHHSLNRMHWTKSRPLHLWPPFSDFSSDFLQYFSIEFFPFNRIHQCD